MNIENIISKYDGVLDKDNEYIFPSVKHAVKAEEQLDKQGCETVRMGDVVTIKKLPT